MSSTNNANVTGTKEVGTASGTASPTNQQTEKTTGPSGIPPAKAQQLMSTTSTALPTKDNAEPSTSAAGATPSVVVQSVGQSRAPSAAGMNVNGMGTFNGGSVNWSTMGGAGAQSGRDPRGKARSRDYLKQSVAIQTALYQSLIVYLPRCRCLQEITYLTSSTTLNPLSATSHAAPNIARPRKVLPENIPTSGPGVYNVTIPPPNRSNSLESNSIPASTSLPPSSSTSQTLPSTLTNTPSFELPPQSQQPHVTQYPSDAASAFVPLKRTISQPGQPGKGSERDQPFTPIAESTISADETAVPSIEPEVDSILDETPPSVRDRSMINL